MSGERAVAAARAAIGTRFRLHGREAGEGLDCVGLAALAMRAAGHRGEVPSGYALRSGDAAGLAARIDAIGLVRTERGAPGDLLLFVVAPGQLHLAIDGGDGIIHADAMLRRVVERPGPPPWPLVARWRVERDS